MICLQEHLDALRAQLTQHEAAADSLQGSVSALHARVEDVRLQAPVLKVPFVQAAPVRRTD